MVIIRVHPGRSPPRLSWKTDRISWKCRNFMIDRSRGHMNILYVGKVVKTCFKTCVIIFYYNLIFLISDGGYIFIFHENMRKIWGQTHIRSRNWSGNHIVRVIYVVYNVCEHISKIWNTFKLIFRYIHGSGGIYTNIYYSICGKICIMHHTCTKDIEFHIVRIMHVVYNVVEHNTKICFNVINDFYIIKS